MNVSCPNKKSEWRKMGLKPELLREAIKEVRKVTKKTLIIKLSPQIADTEEMAKICEEEGADAISLINTIPAMVIDIKKRKSIIGNPIGGLSGPAIRAVAVRMVWEAAKAVKIPIIGVGGITNAEDALQFLIAGATAVAIGTANFINPLCSIEVINGIERFLIEEGIEDIYDLIGTIKQ